MEIAKDIVIISVIILTSLFGRCKSMNFTDINCITIDILSSVLCQVEVCALIRRQAVNVLFQSHKLSQNLIQTHALNRERQAII